MPPEPSQPRDPRGAGNDAAPPAGGLGEFAAAMRFEREAEANEANQANDAAGGATSGPATSGVVSDAAAADPPEPAVFATAERTLDAEASETPRIERPAEPVSDPIQERPAEAPVAAAAVPRREAPPGRRVSSAARSPAAGKAPASAPRVVRSTPEGLIVTPQAVLLGVVGTLFILMFTLIEPSPRWVVLLGTAATTFGMEGVLRSGRRQAFAEGGLDTAPFLLLPALYMLVVPVFIEHATLGFATPLSALFAGVGYGALVVGTLSSVREFDPARDRGRLIAASATYFVAFALFALVFLFGIGQRPATVAVALASVVLAAEILREGEIDPAESLLYSLVVGVVVGETRWVLHYLPIDAYAGALTLLLAFYISTGVLHSYVVRALTRDVARTYASVGIAGVVFIAAARGVGLT